MQNVETTAGEAAEPIVYVVDDDEAMRETLLDLMMISK